MSPEAFGPVFSKLSLLKGFPWDKDAERAQAIQEMFYTSLRDIPDSLARPAIQGIPFQFSELPSVKEFRAWLLTLAPVRTFSVADMDAPRLKALPPPDVDARRIMAGLRARLAGEQKTVVTTPADPAEAGDWGVEYDDGRGVKQQMPARWSEAKARALAAEKAAKYPHLSVGVYRAKKTAGVVAEVAGPAPKKVKVAA